MSESYHQQVTISPAGKMDCQSLQIQEIKKKVPFPSFSYCVTFVREMSEIRNDPAFVFTNSRQPALKRPVYSKRFEVSTDNSNYNTCCQYHKVNHSIQECRASVQNHSLNGRTSCKVKSFILDIATQLVMQQRMAKSKSNVQRVGVFIILQLCI